MFNINLFHNIVDLHCHIEFFLIINYLKFEPQKGERFLVAKMISRLAENSSKRHA